MNREMQNLWLTLCGKGVSQMGSKLFGFAMSFYILKMTGSAQSFAGSLLIATLDDAYRGRAMGVLMDVVPSFSIQKNSRLKVAVA